MGGGRGGGRGRVPGESLELFGGGGVFEEEFGVECGLYFFCFFVFFVFFVFLFFVLLVV